MNADGYPDAMSTENKPKQLSRFASWAYGIGTIAAGCLGIFAVNRFGVAGYIFGLVACLCFLFASYARFARQVQRRRDALLDSAAGGSAS